MITLISITEWKTKRGRERELEERARAKTCDNLRIKVHEMEKEANSSPLCHQNQFSFDHYLFYSLMTLIHIIYSYSYA